MAHPSSGRNIMLHCIEWGWEKWYVDTIYPLSSSFSPPFTLFSPLSSLLSLLFPLLFLTLLPRVSPPLRSAGLCIQGLCISYICGRPPRPLTPPPPSPGEAKERRRAWWREVNCATNAWEPGRNWPWNAEASTWPFSVCAPNAKPSLGPFCVWDWNAKLSPGPFCVFDWNAKRSKNYKKTIKKL